MMKLFIGNLSQDTNEDDLKAVLENHGTVIELRRPLDATTGRPRRFAFATFAIREEGEAAMESLDGSEVDGRELRVNEAEEPAAAGGWERPERVSMQVDVKRVDDRPVGADGRRIRYKSI